MATRKNYDEQLKNSELHLSKQSETGVHESLFSDSADGDVFFFNIRNKMSVKLEELRKGSRFVKFWFWFTFSPKGNEI